MLHTSHQRSVTMLFLEKYFVFLQQDSYNNYKKQAEQR